MSLNLLHANDKQGEYPPSYYADTRIEFAAQPSAQGNLQADVCVIGAGYTGLSAALHLAEKGLKVIVLEAHRVGFGASGRNGGQVGSGQRQDQDWLERHTSREDARRLWDLSQDAKSLVKDLAADMEGVTFRSGIAHACWSQAEVDHAKTYAERLARDYGYQEIEPLDQSGLRNLVGSNAFKGGDIDRGSGHLHPLNFCLGLAKKAMAAGVEIFENSQVLKINHGLKPSVETSEAIIRADHLLLATNGYMGDLAPEVAAKVMPINNFIIATEPLAERAKDILAQPIAVHDTKFVVNYWRLSDDNRLLFGGAESYGYQFPDIKAAVMKPMLEIYPQLRNVNITHAWGGTLAITVNRMPCFMKVAPNVLSASGYSGHGLAIATLAGKLMAEALAGNAQGFDLMASLPKRSFPGGVKLRQPLLVMAMTWFSLRDRLGL